MKHITLIAPLTLLMLITNHNQCAEFRLATINNQTSHTINWEKLPLPGMLGKMQPVSIGKNKSVQPNMPLFPPITLLFENQKNPDQRFLMEINLLSKVLKGGPHFREDPKQHEFTELDIQLKGPDGTVLNHWTQRVNPRFSYNLTIDLKGKGLKKTAVVIMGHEIPMVM